MVLGEAGAAPLAAMSPPVVINELNYHAGSDNPADDFVELYNRGGSAVDLSGWRIDGTGYTFPGGASIAPNGFVVVRGTDYAGSLSNSGETVTLEDASGAVVDAVEYEDAGMWPALADGEGPALERRDAASPAASSGNWLAGGPTPGAPNSVAGPGPLPVFADVTNTVLPAPGAPIVVTATVTGSDNALLWYRVGFGDEQPLWMTLDASGHATAAIPGQGANQLVRYRIVTSNAVGATGTWPRQGDGANYVGTTVGGGQPSELPIFQWYVPDDVFGAAQNDLTLRGDDGYPMVFAYGGVVFDNARMRVKGQVSRTFPKKKWKVILPAGHLLEIDGLLPEPVDEFALHSSWSDKSFIRETLASEAMTMAGAPVSQAFPVRVERNGGFYGLYSYIEQPDGSWRDRFGFDDSVSYEVGGGDVFGELAVTDAGLGEAALRRKYDKETFEYANDDALRDLILNLNHRSGDDKRRWIYEHMDVPAIVNALAVSVVIQHQDWGGHKNYRLILDEHDRWTVAPSDFDLSFGRRWSVEQGPLSSDVSVGGAFEHPGGPLYGTFWFDPELAQMVRRRMRSVAEQLFESGWLRNRVAELSAEVAGEAAHDRVVWGTYGHQQSPSDAAADIVHRFADPQAVRLLGAMAAQGRVAGTPQPAVPSVRITNVVFPGPGEPNERIELTNLSGDTVDLSGFRLDAIDHVIAGGTVLLPGQSLVLVHDDAGSLAGAYQCCRPLDTYGDPVAEADEPLALTNPAGELVARYNLVPPGSQTEIHGAANRSAVVSLIATETGASGWLQVLPCGADAGATSNLNHDAANQTVSGLAVIRFDGDGAACVYNSSATHIVVDLQGYLDDAAIDDVADQRLIDTRSGARPGAATMTAFHGEPGRSAVVSIVATDTESGGWVQVLPCGAAPGGTSNLNTDRGGQTRAALALVRFDATGSACVYNERPMHVIVDLQGYLADDAVDDVADVRLLDTRGGEAPADGAITTVHGGQPGRSAIMSIVATQTTGASWLQVLPCGAAPGATSNLNSDGPDQSRSGLAVVQFDASGTVCIYNDRATHIVVDLQGYLADTAIEDLPDQRLIDTRTR